MDRITEHGLWLGRAVSCGALIQALFGLAPVGHTAHAQGIHAVLVRVEDRTRVGIRNRVVLQTLPGRVDREIYRSQGEIPDDLAVSPEGLYVSFVEFLKGSGGDWVKRLVILDLSGQVVRTIETEGNRGIRRYVWCCGLGMLAILRGSGREDPTFRPETLYVVDARTGTEEPLLGIWRPYQMQWASFDSSLYVKAIPAPGAQGSAEPTFPVYRYHIPTKRLSLTTRQGVFFSPDGLYYFDASVAEPGFRLFSSPDDRDITSALKLPSHQLLARPEGDWMPGTGHVLLFIERQPPPARKGPSRRRAPVRIDPNAPHIYPDRWNLAVDAETGQVIERFQGDISAGWKTNARELPVERRVGAELVRPRGP